MRNEVSTSRCGGGLAHTSSPQACSGRQIDRSIAAPVEIDLETRAVEHDPVGQIADGVLRERVFLAQPLRVVERHGGCYLVTQAMTVVDSRADDRRGTALDGPQRIGADGCLQFARCRTYEEWTLVHLTLCLRPASGRAVLRQRTVAPGGSLAGFAPCLDITAITVYMLVIRFSSR
jgi:hypothetical protein